MSDVASCLCSGVSALGEMEAVQYEPTKDKSTYSILLQLLL